MRPGASRKKRCPHSNERRGGACDAEAPIVQADQAVPRGRVSLAGSRHVGNRNGRYSQAARGVRGPHRRSPPRRSAAQDPSAFPLACRTRAQRENLGCSRRPLWWGIPHTLEATSESDGGKGGILFERVIVFPDGHREIEGVTPKQLPAPDIAPLPAVGEKASSEDDRA